MTNKEQAQKIKAKLVSREVIPTKDEAYIFINAMVGYMNLRAHYHDDPEAIRLSNTAKEYGW